MLVSNCCGSQLYMEDFLQVEDAICGQCLEHCCAVEEE